jgi:hypothetical protein
MGAGPNSASFTSVPCSSKATTSVTSCPDLVEAVPYMVDLELFALRASLDPSG